MELIIGNFQFFLLEKFNFLLIKIKLSPKINPEKKNAKKGLTNLINPLLSKMVFSKKNIETIGARF